MGVTMRRGVAAACAVFVAGLAPAALQSQTTGDTARAVMIVPARVFDAAAGAMHDGWAVLVRGDRIAAVGPRAALTVPPDADLILVGDLFYEEKLAEQVSAFLTGCVASGIEILVGDMGRQPLPLDLLEPLAEYEVPDFGQAKLLKAKVFRFKGKGSQTP